MSELADVLYRWPAAAALGSRVPKEKLYSHGKVSASTKELFVSEVESIVWAYKLADATVNLPGSPDVPEIQVFEIVTRSEALSDRVLAAIDRAVPFPIIFEVVRGEGAAREARMVAAMKRVGPSAGKQSEYYSTGWVGAGRERVTLPAALGLPSLYAALLEPLTQQKARPGEGVKASADRLAKVEALRKDVATLERRIRAEPQFNRRAELHRSLRDKKRELEELK